MKMKTKRTQIARHTFQHGDVIGKRLAVMPDGEQKVIGRRRLVLAHGESGHCHVLEDSDAELVQIGERMLLKLQRAATVTHEEHKPIRIAPGIWEIGRVKEFDYFAMMARPVID